MERWSTRITSASNSLQVCNLPLSLPQRRALGRALYIVTQSIKAYCLPVQKQQPSSRPVTSSRRLGPGEGPGHRNLHFIHRINQLLKTTLPKKHNINFQASPSSPAPSPKLSHLHQQLLGARCGSVCSLSSLAIVWLHFCQWPQIFTTIKISEKQLTCPLPPPVPFRYLLKSDIVPLHYLPHVNRPFHSYMHCWDPGPHNLTCQLLL